MNSGFEDIKCKKIKNLLERENEYEFPEFLSLLREYVGGNRKTVAKELNISDFLLFHWEHGNFKKCIKPSNLALLSDYYKVPFKIMNRKMKEFLEKQA
jgi:hypothetical protein